MNIQSVIKTSNIIKLRPDELLSSALSRLSSSHDAGFVFNEHNQLMGVINPYHCLINNSYPGNAKVEKCLFHAPHLKLYYPISKIAELMIESKIHYLPIFDDANTFIGIMSARHLISHMMHLPLFNISVSDVLTMKKFPPITIYEDDFVAEALMIFKKYKVSKLLVIDREMKLRGVLSYYDLISFLVAPKERFQRGERVGDKISLTHQRIKNFYKSFVLTVSSDTKIRDVIKLIIDKKIGSVIVMGPSKKPIGIITTKDILRLLIKRDGYNPLELVSKNLSEKSKETLNTFFNYLSLWVRKLPDIRKAKLFVKEEKQGGLFEVVLSLISQKGKPRVIKRNGKNLQKVLEDIPHGK